MKINKVGLAHLNVDKSAAIGLVTKNLVKKRSIKRIYAMLHQQAGFNSYYRGYYYSLGGFVGVLGDKA